MEAANIPPRGPLGQDGSQELQMSTLPLSLRIWFLTAFASLAVPGCGGQADLPISDPDKTLVIGVSQEPDALFGIVGNLMVSGDVGSFIWRPLLLIDSQRKPYCVLCTELPSLENGLWKVDHENGVMETTFHLRRGLQWADGTEITARDAAFAWELMSDGQYPHGASYLEPIGDVEALDSHTLRVVYKTLWPFGNADVRLRLIPEHYYRPIWERYRSEGGAYWDRFLADERVSVYPRANGPFQVREWVSGSHILLVRNPAYNLGPPPRLERILVRVIPDLNALAIAVSTRQVHLTDGWLTLEQARELEESPGIGIRYVGVAWLEHVTVQINHPPFDDLRVRRALLLAIDRAGINQAIFRGKQPPAHSWVHPGHPAHNPHLEKYRYDPERARRLLEQAGWSREGEGPLRNARGEPMRLTLITVAGDRTRLQVASVVQALWQELGIEVEIRPQSARLLFPDTLQKQNLAPGGAAIWRWVVQPEATVSAYGLWWPKGTNLDQLTEGSPWDAVQENKDLIRQALGTIDDEQRYGLLRRQQEVWVRELPTLPLYWHVRVVSMDRRLEGYTPYPDLFLGWGVEAWKLEGKRKKKSVKSKTPSPAGTRWIRGRNKASKQSGIFPEEIISVEVPATRKLRAFLHSFLCFSEELSSGGDPVGSWVGSPRSSVWDLGFPDGVD